MALLMKNVNAVTIPEGSVKRIMQYSPYGPGAAPTILWQKTSYKIYRFTVQATNGTSTDTKEFTISIKE